MSELLEGFQLLGTRLSQQIQTWGWGCGVRDSETQSYQKASNWVLHVGDVRAIRRLPTTGNHTESTDPDTGVGLPCQSYQKASNYLVLHVGDVRAVRKLPTILPSKLLPCNQKPVLRMLHSAPDEAVRLKLQPSSDKCLDTDVTSVG